MTKKQYERLKEIEEGAVNCYLNHADFEMREWIDEDDLDTWKKLKAQQTGECLDCYENIINCKCKK